MHSRKLRIDGKTRTLTFGHEGVLYKNSFVIYDLWTDSKWNHSTGLAMVGPLAGRELTMLPTRMMRWEDWRELHPDTLVLTGRSRGGFMGTYTGDSRSTTLGLSVGRGPNAVLYPMTVLSEKIVVNDVVNGQPIAVVTDSTKGQMFAYYRVVDDRTLTFEPRREPPGDTPLLVDRETGSTWDLLSGEAVEGPLRGKVLKSVVSVTWRIDRWRQIYESGTVYQAR